MAKELIRSGVSHHFEKLGVWVTIPPQEDGKSLEIKGPLDYDKLENKASEPEGFELIRLVINFQVEEEDGTIVKRFNPAMVLEVGLTDYDFGHQPEGEDPKLAFWDVEKGLWKVFANQELGMRETTTAAKAWITAWGDPAVGVGRFQ